MRAKEFLTELKKFSHSGQGYGGSSFPGEQWRGPHQGKELKMMLAGIKPAAILNSEEDLPLWEPYIKDGTFILGSYWLYGKVGNPKGYVVALPNEKYRLQKIIQLLEVPPVQDKAPSESFHIKLGRLLGYEKEHINKFLDATKQFREDAGDTVTLYHVTQTKSVPSIRNKGICLLQPTNWTKGTGERYGNGNIFAFDNMLDAIRWAGKWDWDQNGDMGTGKVSIVTFKADPANWQEDPAEDYAKMSAKGRWLTSDRHVPKQNIISVTPVTSELMKSGVIKTTEAKINAVGKGKGKKSYIIPLHGEDNVWNPAEYENEELISKMPNGMQVWLNTDKDYHFGRNYRTYHLYNPKIKKTVLSVTGSYNPKSQNLSHLELASSRQNTVKAQDFYHWLITQHDISLEAGDQSVGAKKVWQKLGKKKGVNIHGWKQGKPVNVTPGDEDEAYYYAELPYSDPTVANMSLIAHKKTNEEQLNELANAPYEYVMTKSSPSFGNYGYKFETDSGQLYNVGIWWEDDRTLEIGFNAQDRATGKQNVSITGTGDAFRVFATIKEILRSYLASVSGHNGQPKFIKFSGKNTDPSRLKLYDKIVKTAPKWIPGYKVSEILDYGDSRHYELKRQDVQ